MLHRVMSENPDIRSLTEANRQEGGGSYEQKLHLGEMVVAAVKAREAEDATDVQHTLEPAADAVSVGPESSGWLANISFLVARDSAASFLDAVEQVRTGSSAPRSAGQRPAAPVQLRGARPRRARGHDVRRGPGTGMRKSWDSSERYSCCRSPRCAAAHG